MGKWLRGGVALIGGWVVFFLLLQGAVGGVSSIADNEVVLLPDTRGMGLEYARKVVLAKNFPNVTAHDATGRARGLRTGQDWRVCQQYTLVSGVLQPVSGRVKRSTKLDLGVVLLDEPCIEDPTINQPNVSPQAYPMPDFRGVTPADVLKAVRSEASLRFYSTDGRRLSGRDYTKWRVCSQQLRAGATFFGQPVAFTAMPFDKQGASGGKPPVPNDLDQVCPDRAWRGVKGFEADQFPSAVPPGS